MTTNGGVIVHEPAGSSKTVVYVAYVRLLNRFYLRADTQTGERSIFERGCLRAGEEWLELNLVPVAGAVVSTMVLQVYFSPASSAP